MEAIRKEAILKRFCTNFSDFTPRRAQISPSRAQISSLERQDGARRPQEVPQEGQNDSQEAQETENEAQETPRRRPGVSQEVPRGFPGANLCRCWVPREGSWEQFWIDFRVNFWDIFFE